MAASAEREDHAEDPIVTPSKKTSVAWKYFGYRKSHRDKKNVLCKLCEKPVAHAGGTTNLKNHLFIWHRKEHDQLYKQTKEKDQQPLTSFATTTSRTPKLPATSDRAKMLTQGVAKFIAQDLRPISVVDGVGFLNLMHLAEPRYVVPCRSTITSRITKLYSDVKEQVSGLVTQQQHLTLTSDMWTSRVGDGYISLTCHCITPEFEVFHKNLLTQNLPGVHDHGHIAEALQTGTRAWGIDLEQQVFAFTTNNGSNIVKSVEEDLGKLRIPCAGHTLNLSVQAALKVSRLSTILARCRQIVGHFNRSRTDREELTAKQALLELPQHNLIQEVSTRWNSTHDMILRLCEQQPAIAAVFHRRRDLLHLECSPSEWRILEDVADVLQPFKIATEYLSGEKFPTISALGPLLAEVRAKIEFAPNDTPVVREVKKVLASDMHTRYQNREVIEVLNISSLLDPRFKTLAHLSEEVQEETFHCLKEAMMKQFDESPSTSMCSDNPAAAPDPPPPKKSKSNPLQQLLGNKFQDANSLGSSSTVATIDEIVSSEISRYKAEKPAGLDEKILLWWKARRDAYPNLSETARKYLGIVATSVPSERLFSI